MQVIKGGVKELNKLIDTASLKAAVFFRGVLFSMDHLKFLLNSRQLPREQYDTLKEEVRSANNKRW
jgi:hypothetical protein